MSDTIGTMSQGAQELAKEVSYLATALDSIIARMEATLADLAKVVASLEQAAEVEPDQWAGIDLAEPDPADSGLVPLTVALARLGAGIAPTAAPAEPDRPYTQKVIDSTTWVPVPLDNSEILAQPPTHEPPSGPAVIHEITRLAELAQSLAAEDIEPLAAQMAVLGGHLTLTEIEQRYKQRWSDDNPDVQPAAVKAWEWLAGHTPTPPSLLWYTGHQAGQAAEWKAG